MFKWLQRGRDTKIAKVVDLDTTTAREFIHQNRISFTGDLGIERKMACSDGIEMVSARIAKTHGVPQTVALTAIGFEATKLDDIHRWTLEISGNASRLRNSDSETEDAKMTYYRMQVGGLVLGHLYRMRFMETQVTGIALEKVRAALLEIQGFISEMRTV